LHVELDSDGSIAAFPRMQEQHGLRSRQRGRLHLVLGRRLARTAETTAVTRK
jgi:hypothetical protein